MENIKLKKGIYQYDISCKNGKSHIFDNAGCEIFEGELSEVFRIFNNNLATNTKNLFEKEVKGGHIEDKKIWIITKWCKSITESHKDKYVNKDKRTKDMVYKFRILDDDNIIYGYGMSSKKDIFAPLVFYRNIYGVTSIQWKNETGKYEYL